MRELSKNLLPTLKPTFYILLHVLVQARYIKILLRYQMTDRGNEWVQYLGGVVNLLILTHRFNERKNLRNEYMDAV